MSKCIIPTAEGGYKHVYPTQIVIAAQGGKALPAELGLADPWSIHISLKKRPCTEDGEPIMFDGSAQEMPETPIGSLAIADILHDEQVQGAVALLMSSVNRLITGDLKAQSEEVEDEAD